MKTAGRVPLVVDAGLLNGVVGLQAWRAAHLIAGGLAHLETIHLADAPHRTLCHGLWLAAVGNVCNMALMACGVLSHDNCNWKAQCQALHKLYPMRPNVRLALTGLASTPALRADLSSALQVACGAVASQAASEVASQAASQQSPPPEPSPLWQACRLCTRVREFCADADDLTWCRSCAVLDGRLGTRSCAGLDADRARSGSAQRLSVLRGHRGADTQTLFPLDGGARGDRLRPPMSLPVPNPRHAPRLRPFLSHPPKLP